MRSSSGNNIKYTLFGESHGDEIGIEIFGIKSGFEIDFEKIDYQLRLRQGGEKYNTSRQEKVEYTIKSGVDKNRTNGEKIVIVFKNEKQKSRDYNKLKHQPRPGHADYVAMTKYKKFISGGGHFSGRLTAPLVFLGQLCMQLIKKEYPNFEVISHINKFQNFEDISYYEIRKELAKNVNDIEQVILLRSTLHKRLLALRGLFFEESKFEKYQLSTEDLINKKTTAGGEIETIIIGSPSLVGEPFFDTIEGCFSKALYSIPSVKGVSFGYGNSFINTKGHLVKDEIKYFDNNSLYTLFNYNGGINGGITNGEDIVFKTVLKPIASIMQEQLTYNNLLNEVMPLTIGGRHDVTIVNRIIPVIESVVCIEFYDLILESKKINNQIVR